MITGCANGALRAGCCATAPAAAFKPGAAGARRIMPSQAGELIKELWMKIGFGLPNFGVHGTRDNILTLARAADVAPKSASKRGQRAE